MPTLVNVISWTASDSVGCRRRWPCSAKIPKGKECARRGRAWRSSQLLIKRYFRVGQMLGNSGRHYSQLRTFSGEFEQPRSARCGKTATLTDTDGTVLTIAPGGSLMSSARDVIRDRGLHRAN